MHCVAVQLLPAEAATGVQLATPAPGLVTVLQVVVTLPLAKVGPDAVHDPAGVGPDATVLQLVVVKPFPLVGPLAVQIATGEGPVLLSAHVVAR